MAKRLFDIFFSFLGIVFFLIPAILISISIIIESRGGVFYRQRRVGKGETVFRIFKFRTMFVDSDKKGLLTVGKKDPRVTRVGQFLRKTKLDEMPQLINVLIGDMSFVGPRPEVEKYVALYSEAHRIVFSVRPGITDVASIEFIDENSFLEKYDDPENAYIQFVMPEKLRLNIDYLNQRSFWKDIMVIFKTFIKILH